MGIDTSLRRECRADRCCAVVGAVDSLASCLCHVRELLETVTGDSKYD